MLPVTPVLCREEGRGGGGGGGGEGGEEEKERRAVSRVVFHQLLLYLTKEIH